MGDFSYVSEFIYQCNGFHCTRGVVAHTVFCCESFYKRKEISYSYHLDSFCPIHCCGLEKPLLCEKAQYQKTIEIYQPEKVLALERR